MYKFLGIVLLLLGVQGAYAQAPSTDTTTDSEEATTAATETAQSTEPVSGETASETTVPTAAKSVVYEDYEYETYSDEELSAELDELLEEEESSIIEFDVSGYYRIRGTIVDEPDVWADAYPKNLAFMQHRLWVSPEVRLRTKPSVKLMADILFGENTQPCQDPSVRTVLVHPCTGLWGANGDNILATNTADQFANITVARVYGEARDSPSV